MNEINNMYHLLIIDQAPNKCSYDIKEHLVTLYKYSKECDSVFETGVRGCVSSWAFLKGLLDSENKTKKRLFVNDVNSCDVSELLSISKNFDIDIKYEWNNNLLLEFNETYDANTVI